MKALNDKIYRPSDISAILREPFWDRQYDLFIGYGNQPSDLSGSLVDIWIERFFPGIGNSNNEIAFKLNLRGALLKKYNPNFKEISTQVVQQNEGVTFDAYASAFIDGASEGLENVAETITTGAQQVSGVSGFLIRNPLVVVGAASVGALLWFGWPLLIKR